MDKENIRYLISKGLTKLAIKELQAYRDELSDAIATDGQILAARFSRLQENYRRGLISMEEYDVAINRINDSILQITEIEQSVRLSKAQVMEEVEALGIVYSSLSGEENRAERLRSKNMLVKEIYKLIAELRELPAELFQSDYEGVMSALAYYVQMNPDVRYIKQLDLLAGRAESHFTKGIIVNALGAIVYSGQIRFGDDVAIGKLLSQLSRHADLPLTKNIERVETALQYLIGQ